MKKTVLLCLVVILLATISGCPNPWVYANHPCMQYDTTWARTDGKVTFYIPESYTEGTHTEGCIFEDTKCVEIMIEAKYPVITCFLSQSVGIMQK